MSATISWAIRLMLVVSVPAVVGLIVLAHPIIELVFERRAFDANSTLMTAGALACYAPGIVGYSIVKIASPSFYSLREARTPVIISMITIAANLALNLWLNSFMSFRGLALGTAIAANINAGLLLIALSRRIGGIEFPRVLRTFIKICIASAVMGAATYYGHEWLRSALPGPSELRRLLRVLGAIGLGMAVLAGTAHLLRLEEFGTAMSRIVGRLRRTRGPENPRT